MTKNFPTTSALIVSVAVLAFAQHASADPIKLQPVAVTASHSAPDSSPYNVSDGDGSTYWNAGDYGPQWIQLDLGRTVALRKLRLQVAQLPSGSTQHVVTAGPDPSHLSSVTTFASYTSSGQWLEYNLGAQNLGNIRYVRITTLQSPSWIAWGDIELYGGVEYLGYYADAFNSDYMSETIANGANLVWIANSATPLSYEADFSAKLAEAHARGAKAVLHLQDQLFDGVTLRTGWQTEWSQNLVPLIRQAPPNTVAAFYLFDEPSGRVAASDLNLVASQVRADFPGIPIAVIFPWEHVQPDANGRILASDYIPTFDWIGFDCYGVWDNCQGGGPVAAMISHLRSALVRPDQRMIAVPWAFRWGATGAGNTAQNENLQVINKWQEEVMSDGRYVAVLPFLWQSVDLDGNGIVDPGARDLPWVKQRLYQLAHSLFYQGDNRVFPVDFSASGAGGESLPFGAFDGDTSNAGGWNGGGFPTQWIQADFGGLTQVGRIQLWVWQLPGGPTTHHIDGLTADGTCVRMGTLQGSTQEGQLLTWRINFPYGVPFDVRSVRLTTTQSPSWVAWHDIQFFVN